MSEKPSPALEFDAQWEQDAEERLEMVEYDTELGKQLARDSQRLAAGEISESTFYEKYHDAVVEEFGVDQRGDVTPPDDDENRFGYDTAGDTDPDGSGGNGQEPSVPGEDPNRRDVMKTAGAVGAAAVGVNTAEGIAHTVNGGEEESTEDTQWGMAINQNNCIACLNCVEACNEENNNTPDSLWMFVHRYVEDDYTDKEEYLTRPCQHCSDAPCTTACPVASRHTRDRDGIVLTDYETCIGCRYCEVACPYGVNYLQWATPREREEFESSGMEMGDLVDDLDDDTDPEEELRYESETAEGVEAAGNPPKGVMGKCTFCVHRQDSGIESLEGTTACEDVCPTDAIHFGNLEDSESAPRQHLSNIDDNESTFRLLEAHGTQPNVIYVGNEPSPQADPVEGPRKVEDMNRDLQRHRTDREPVSYAEEGE